MAGQAALQRIDLLMHGAGVADDAPGPVEHPLALRREALEPRSPLYQEHPEGFLQLLDAGGEGGLADAAGLGGTPEMALAGERDDEFELFDHAGSLGLFAPEVSPRLMIAPSGDERTGRNLELHPGHQAFT